MTWVRRAAAPAHTCAPPMRDIVYTTAAEYSPGNQPARWVVTDADGSRGDLWRCDTCRSLWRVGAACDWCNAYGPGSHPGQHEAGAEWRPATLWQRLRHRPGHP